jgi:O-antigen/teichoic acid export membrane protein
VFMANPAAVIGVPLKSIYRAGGPALRILSVGMIFFSLFTVANTVLNAAGRTRDTIISGLLTLAASVLCNVAVVPRASTLAQALELCAYCSAGAMALGCVVSIAFLHRAFCASISLVTVLRTCLGIAAGLVLGWLLPERSKLFTLAECALVLVAYFAVLVIVRELQGSDLAGFSKVLRRRRGI